MNSNPQIDQALQDIDALPAKTEAYADAHARWNLDMAAVDDAQNQATLDIDTATKAANLIVAQVKATGDKAIADAKAEVDAANAKLAAVTAKAGSDLEVAQATADHQIAQATSDANAKVTIAKATADSSNSYQQKLHADEIGQIAKIRGDVTALGGSGPSDPGVGTTGPGTDPGTPPAAPPPAPATA